MKSAFGMCLNWKVLAGAGVAVVAVLVFNPAAAVAVIPLAILAVCPLSMVLMMFAMKKGMSGHPAEATTPEAAAQRLQALKQEQRELEQQIEESRETAVPPREEKVHLAS